MNNIENIDKIRKEAISEIKEKIKNNPGHSGYLHPCNKKRQEDMKILGFSNGNEFTHWMQKNGIMRNPTNVRRASEEKIAKDAGFKTYKDHLDKLAQNAGFKDQEERILDRFHKIGKCSPMQLNKDCTTYFGIWIAENYIVKTFEDVDKAPYGTIGYDWICNKGKKIECKARCLDSANRWSYPIADNNNNYNTIADYFIISAWDNRESLNPLHIWIFHRDDIVRREPFWMRSSISISNTKKGLKEFEKFEVTGRLDKLKELCGSKKL